MFRSSIFYYVKGGPKERVIRKGILGRGSDILDVPLWGTSTDALLDSGGRVSAVVGVQYTHSLESPLRSIVGVQKVDFRVCST